MSKVSLLAALALVACGSSDANPPDSSLGDVITVTGAFGDDAVVTFATADGTPIGEPSPLPVGGQVQRACPPDTTVTVVAEGGYSAVTVVAAQPGDTIAPVTRAAEGTTAPFPMTAPRPAGANQVRAELGACLTEAALTSDPTTLQMQIPSGCFGQAPFDDGLFYAVDTVTSRVLAAAHVDAVASGGTITWHDTPPSPLIISGFEAVAEVNFRWSYDVTPAVSPFGGYSKPIFPDGLDTITLSVSPSPAIAPNLLLGLSELKTEGNLRNRDYVKRHPNDVFALDVREIFLPELEPATLTQESGTRVRVKWANPEARAMSDALEVSLSFDDAYWTFLLPPTATELVTPPLIPLDVERVNVYLRFIDVEVDGYAELRQSLGVEGLTRRRASEGTFLARRTTSVY